MKYGSWTIESLKKKEDNYQRRFKRQANLHLIYLLTQSSCHKSNESNIQNQGKKRMNEFIWIIIEK